MYIYDISLYICVYICVCVCAYICIPCTHLYSKYCSKYCQSCQQDTVVRTCNLKKHDNSKETTAASNPRGGNGVFIMVNGHTSVNLVYNGMSYSSFRIESRSLDLPSYEAEAQLVAISHT